MAGRARMLDGAPSSCLPPWLETMMASAPCCTAFSASSGSRMPLITSLPPQRSLMWAMSSQLSLGSNCLATQGMSWDRSVTSLACPAMLRKVRRWVLSIFSPHSILVARLSRLNNVGRGGTVSPFLMSRWRCPTICKSAVKTSALHWAALARRIKSAINSRSRIT